MYWQFLLGIIFLLVPLYYLSEKGYGDIYLVTGLPLGCFFIYDLTARISKNSNKKEKIIWSLRFIFFIIYILIIIYGNFILAPGLAGMARSGGGHELGAFFFFFFYFAILVGFLILWLFFELIAGLIKKQKPNNCEKAFILLSFLLICGTWLFGSTELYLKFFGILFFIGFLAGISVVLVKLEHALVE